MSRWMWKVVENKVRKIGMVETKIRRNKRRIEEEKVKRGKDNRNKESSKGIGNLEWQERGGKIRGRSKVSQIRYSLVMILELNSVSEVQYKEVIIIDDE